MQRPSSANSEPPTFTAPEGLGPPAGRPAVSGNSVAGGAQQS